MSDQPNQTVWVIMGNDYPCAVRSTEALADKYIYERQRADRERRVREGRTASGHGIYYRSYQFTLDKG